MNFVGLTTPSGSKLNRKKRETKMLTKGYWFYFQQALNRMVNEEGQEVYHAQVEAHEEAFEKYPLGPNNDGVPVDLTFLKDQRARKKAYLDGSPMPARSSRTPSGKKVRPAMISKVEEYTAVQQGVMVF